MPNSATLVQALLAAFCAILCAFHFSAFGGGGMSLIMRRNLMAAKSGYTALGYIGAKEAHDGQPSPLVAMWDGIENAGWGVHDANATVWKDLIGVRDLDTLVNVEFLTERVRVSKGRAAGGALFSNIARTVEACFVSTSGSNNTRFIFSGITKTSTGSYRFIFDYNNRIVFASGNYNNSVPRNPGANTISCLYTQQGSSDIPGVSQSCFLNGVEKELSYGSNRNSAHKSTVTIGGGYDANNSTDTQDIFCVRVYDRHLTLLEAKHNYAIDKARFNLT